MGLTHPIGLLLLGGLAALVWLFRKRDRLRNARPVSTRRWFTEIAAQQMPQWSWHLWPLFCALCALMATFLWLWTQPHRALVPVSTEVWDAGLNMPDGTHPETIVGKEAIPGWLRSHPGEMILHTNLQVGAWGETTTLPDRVRIVPEGLPRTVGITNAGIVDGKIWVQLHNSTGAGWSGNLTLDNDQRSLSVTPVDVGADGAFILLDCPEGFTAGALAIQSPDPWTWDDSFFIGQKKERAQIALRTDNPFLKTWAKMHETSGFDAARTVVLTQWASAEVSGLLKRGLLVVLFCNADTVGGLESFGVRVANQSALQERGITTAWPDLGSLRIVRFTTVAETTGWDRVLWAGESGRAIVGEKRIGGGTLRAVVGPLTMPETELPVVPLFIPWMSRVTEFHEDQGLTALWSTDRTQVAGVTATGVVNYDRALIQPIAGRIKREPGAMQAPTVVAWNVLLWVALGCAAITSVYLWQKKF